MKREEGKRVEGEESLRVVVEGSSNVKMSLDGDGDEGVFMYSSSEAPLFGPRHGPPGSSHPTPVSW